MPFRLFARPKIRFESFGGIIATERPAALVFVDRDFLRNAGHDGGARWRGDPAGDLLSAPTEVHFAFTHRCDAGCAHCYTDSGPEKTGGLDMAGIVEVADALAKAGVFHVALGGGESTEDPRLLDIARAFRARGIVPNLTTNGLHVDEAFAREARIFGVINVSLDGIGDRYGGARGYDGFEAADAAIRLLRRHHEKVGINCVVTRRNFDHLPEVVRYARRRRLSNVELLRVKPAGRGRESFSELTMTRDQGRAFFPLVKTLARRHRLSIHVDCSLAPFLCYHAPDRALMTKLGLFGCEGGNVLASVGPDGAMSACSFHAAPELDARAMEADWPGAFEGFRRYPERAPEPCASCAYLPLCKGGCHVVAGFLTGDPFSPDPECPRVVEWREGPQRATSAEVTTLSGGIAPRSNAATFARVVSAIFARASRVKKA